MGAGSSEARLVPIKEGTKNTFKNKLVLSAIFGPVMRLPLVFFLMWFRGLLGYCRVISYHEAVVDKTRRPLQYRNCQSRI